MVRWIAEYLTSEEHNLLSLLSVCAARKFVLSAADWLLRCPPGEMLGNEC